MGRSKQPVTQPKKFYVHESSITRDETEAPQPTKRRRLSLTQNDKKNVDPFSSAILIDDSDDDEPILPPTTEASQPSTDDLDVDEAPSHEARSSYLLSVHDQKLSDGELQYLEPVELPYDDIPSTACVKSLIAANGGSFPFGAAPPSSQTTDIAEQRASVMEKFLSRLPNDEWARFAQFATSVEPPRVGSSSFGAVPARRPSAKTDWTIADPRLDALFRTMVAKVRTADRSINIAHLVAPSGSLDDPIMFHLHCPNFNCSPDHIRYGNVADVSNPSLRVLSRHFSGLDNALTFDFVSLRIKHNGDEGCPPWLSLPKPVLDAMDDLTKAIYESSNSKASIILGKHPNDNYNKLFPNAECVSISDTPLFGKRTHMYVQSFGADPAQGIRRLDFVSFHPSAHLYGAAHQVADLLKEITAIATALVFRKTSSNLIIQDNKAIVDETRRLRVPSNAIDGELATFDYRAYSKTPDCVPIILAAQMRIVENRSHRLFSRAELPDQIIKLLSQRGGDNSSSPSVSSSFGAVPAGTSLSPFGHYVEVEARGNVAVGARRVADFTPSLRKLPTDMSVAAQQQSLVVQAMEVALPSDPGLLATGFALNNSRHAVRVKAWCLLAGQPHLWKAAAAAHGFSRIAQGWASKREGGRDNQDILRGRPALWSEFTGSQELPSPGDLCDLGRYEPHGTQKKFAVGKLRAWALELDGAPLVKNKQGSYANFEQADGTTVVRVRTLYKSAMRRMERKAVADQKATIAEIRLFETDKDAWVALMVKWVLPDSVGKIPQRWKHLRR